MTTRQPPSSVSPGSRPQALTLLIDTYDTERGAAIVAGLAPRLAAQGITISAVRLDSGDLAAHARAVRAILDAAGLQAIRIFASGGLDEHSLLALCRGGAPIDGFGVGTSLTTSSDAPALDCAYKLQEYAGRPRRKRSEGKATWPGRKQVYRRYHADGTIAGDVVALIGEADGRRAAVAARHAQRQARAPACLDLAKARAHAAASLAQLPEALRRLEPGRCPGRDQPGHSPAGRRKWTGPWRRIACRDRRRSRRRPAATVIDFLSHPASYGLHDGEVERIETHCSIVFLAADRAYKLKRAIRYASLDYTTRELRQAACEAELVLNRRTAPELYLGVRSINRGANGALAFDGAGAALDHVVVMRRFAAVRSVRRHGEHGDADARADACSRRSGRAPASGSREYAGNSAAAMRSGA